MRPLHLRHPAMGLAWRLLAVAGVLAAIWLALSPIDLKLESTFSTARGVLTLIAISGFTLLVRRRLANDRARPARLLVETARRVNDMALAGAFIITFTTIAAALSYLAVSVNAPLIDPLLADFDRRLGFDWLAMLAWTNERPDLARALTFVYGTSLPQVIGLVIALSLLRRPAALAEFLALFAITSVVVIVVSALLPAAGAFIHHAPGPHLNSNLNPRAGIFHIEQFEALRSGTFRLLDLRHIEGLVTFPSFHTILAILVTYAVRSIRWLFWPVLALNAAVIWSTLPEGGHYLVDLIAGAAVAYLAILAVSQLRSREVRAPIARGGLVPAPAAHVSALGGAGGTASKTVQ